MSKQDKLQNIREWVKGLNNIGLVLYANEFGKLLDLDGFRDLILYCDAQDIRAIILEECVERLRMTLPEEDQ